MIAMRKPVISLNETVEKLPKKVAICRQYRKCGKPRCRCTNGRLHGPYYFYFYRVGGRLKKTYIRQVAAKDLWEKYSLLLEVRRKRDADRKQFTSLCRDLRNIDALIKQLPGL